LCRGAGDFTPSFGGKLVGADFAADPATLGRQGSPKAKNTIFSAPNTSFPFNSNRNYGTFSD
jgi:hypothetical protein